MTPAAILLAAGGSRRMGSPKQLLIYQGEPLVRRAARTILAAGFSPLCVVVGDQHERVIAALNGLEIMVCLNPDWSRGIGSSVRLGIAELEHRFPESSAALIALADQPGVAPDHLRALAAGFHSGVDIVASAYDGTLGVPALFDRSLFAKLLTLPEESGAKRLIAAQTGNITTVELKRSQDIDTPEDFEQLTSNSHIRYYM